MLVSRDSSNGKRTTAPISVRRKRSRPTRKAAVSEERERQSGRPPGTPEAGADRVLDLAEVVRTEVGEFAALTLAQTSSVGVSSARLRATFDGEPKGTVRPGTREQAQRSRGATPHMCALATSDHALATGRYQPSFEANRGIDFTLFAIHALRSKARPRRDPPIG